MSSKTVLCLQLGFVGIPLFKTMVELFEEAQPMLDGVLTNFRHWEAGTADADLPNWPWGAIQGVLENVLWMPEPLQTESGMLTAFLFLPVVAQMALVYQVCAHSVIFFLLVSANRLFSSSLKLLLTGFSFFLWAVLADETCTPADWSMGTWAILSGFCWCGFAAESLSALF